MIELTKAKKVMGKNFIGPGELEKIAQDFKIKKPSQINLPIPKIIYSQDLLNNIKDDYILILGIPYDWQDKPLTINQMRKNLGKDPAKFEPCFYNQDWYLKEGFAAKRTLDFKWHLISKEVKEESRGKDPDSSPSQIKNKEVLPTAILTAFTFFAYYFCNNEILWGNDFIWCHDMDHNGDRIYTGRYIDLAQTNKNGFNIHRHLKIRSCYGIAPQIL
jgi:hypothetical protein